MARGRGSVLIVEQHQQASRREAAPALTIEETAALDRCHSVVFSDITSRLSPEKDIKLWKSIVRSAKEFGNKSIDDLDPFWRQAALARTLDRLLNDHPLLAETAHGEPSLRYLREEAANLLRKRYSFLHDQAEQIDDPAYRQALDAGLSKLSAVINDLSYASADQAAAQQHLRAGKRLLLKLEGLALLSRFPGRPHQDDPAIVAGKTRVMELTGQIPDALVLDLADEGLEHSGRWRRFFSTASGGPASYTVALRMITINSAPSGSNKERMLGHELIHSTQRFPKSSDLSADARQAELALLEGTTEALTVLLENGKLTDGLPGYPKYVAMTLALASKLDMDTEQALLELNQVDDGHRLDWFKERIPDLPEDLISRMNAFTPATTMTDMQSMIDAFIESLDTETWQRGAQAEGLPVAAHCIE